jgi:RHS repeat-associated protein
MTAAETGGGSPASYGYDFRHARRRKLVAAAGVELAETIYVAEHFEVRADEPRRYVQIGPVQLARLKPGQPAPDVYYLTDNVGSATLVLAASSTAREQRAYFPFGRGRKVARLGGGDEPRMYVGKELDSETGLLDFGARSYSPDIGSFLSYDPALPETGGNPYLYGDRSPLSKFDPDGAAAHLSLLLRVWKVFEKGYELNQAAGRHFAIHGKAVPSETWVREVNVGVSVKTYHQPDRYLREVLLPRLKDLNSAGRASFEAGRRVREFASYEKQLAGALKDPSGRPPSNWQAMLRYRSAKNGLAADRELVSDPANDPYNLKAAFEIVKDEIRNVLEFGESHFESISNSTVEAADEALSIDWSSPSSSPD